MPFYDDDPLLAALALPGAAPRGRGGFRGNGNNRSGGGDRGQGRGRGRGGRGGGCDGRGGSQNLNFNHVTNTPHTAPNASPSPVTNGFRARSSGEPGSFRGRGASPNAPQPFNTRGGRGGTQNRGRGGGRGGYNQTNVGIQSLGYDYNAMRGGLPKRDGRFGVDFGEDDPHSRKIKFAKHSVGLFDDQEEVFKPEVAEIETEDPNKSLAAADQVNAGFRDDEEPSESDGDKAAGDIGFATHPLEGDEDEDEGEDMEGRRADAAATGRKGKKKSFTAIIEEFVEDDERDTLQMRPMSKAAKKIVRKIAAAYKLKSAPNKKMAGSYWGITLSKTQKTGEKLNAALQGRRASQVPKRMTDDESKKPWHQEGDIVGRQADKINESNAGYRLLQTNPPPLRYGDLERMFGRLTVPR